MCLCAQGSVASSERRCGCVEEAAVAPTPAACSTFPRENVLGRGGQAGAPGASIERSPRSPQGTVPSCSNAEACQMMRAGVAPAEGGARGAGGIRGRPAMGCMKAAATYSKLEHWNANSRTEPSNTLPSSAAARQVSQAAGQPWPPTHPAALAAAGGPGRSGPGRWPGSAQTHLLSCMKQQWAGMPMLRHCRVACRMHKG